MNTTIRRQEIETFEKLNAASRENIYHLIQGYLYLADTARREGILALESDAEYFFPELEKNFPEDEVELAKELLQLVTDGVEREYILQCGENYLASPLPPEDSLFLRIVTNGTLYIQSGDNPQIIKMLLVSLLGVSGRKDFCGWEKNHSFDQYKEHMDTIRNDWDQKVSFEIEGL